MRSNSRQRAGCTGGAGKHAAVQLRHVPHECAVALLVLLDVARVQAHLGHHGLFFGEAGTGVACQLAKYGFNFLW